MWFAGGKFVTDLHNADSTLGFGNIVFTFLWSVVREHILKLLRSDKENLFREYQVDVIILDCHILFRFAETFVYGTNGLL